MNRTGKPRRAKSSTIAGVASVDPESTTTISAQSPRLSRHFPMQAASLKQITAALTPSARLVDSPEGRAGDRAAGSFRAISPSAFFGGAGRAPSTCLILRAVRSAASRRMVQKATPLERVSTVLRGRFAAPQDEVRGAAGVHAPISGPIVRGWQVHRTYAPDPMLAGPPSRHHIAAMIEPSPSPIPVLA